MSRRPFSVFSFSEDFVAFIVANSDQTLSIMNRESAKDEIRLLVEKYSRIVKEERDIQCTPET